MDKKEELKKSMEEERQRAKDSLANVEKMQKQLEELEKKEPEVSASATGVFLKENFTKNYYSVNSDNKLVQINGCKSIFDGAKIDIDRMSVNNCFATKEAAKQEALRREGQEFIRRCAMLWNKDNDWRKGYEEKFEIFYDFANKKLNIGRLDNYKSFGTICFDTQELAEKCIAELRKKYNDSQIKTIFGMRG